MKSFLFFIGLSIVTISQGLVLPKTYADRKVCPFPNGTESSIHVFNCDNGNMPMTVKKAQITDDKGNAIYPIDPRKDIIIALTAINNGLVYNDNRVRVKISEFTTNWLTGKCDWIEIPTFGLLNDIDGCSYAHNCPLAKGDLTLKLPINLSKFSGIINAIAGQNPYQIEIRMQDYNEGDTTHEEFSCVVTQLRFSEKN
ncbi:MD-2-related lipid-recognition domain-containing protein [Strongyloides ratti]|uniref:MD-2-related lipid-recognition domain-containing protein n=1 Tax=Strongyloides ratti TaxID=34506 RepID=A0A090LL36_STRRB|nr:MD-2-related lipid-recognition domain-containing protein [Strongyloides ratti]CEF68888.1 MD-2-related lipid-recognition domain-containing protein [Strongyloides ratti]